MRNTLGACIVVMFAATIAWADPERVISVSGHGTVEMAPDMASLEIGVSNQADTAAEALSLTSDAMADIIARMTAEQIEPRDVQTQGVSLQPVWSAPQNKTEPRTITGFAASNMLTVRVRDLDRLGAILDLAAQDGANTFRGLRFSVQDPASAQAKARAEAVADAMAKAEQLAAAAGVTLGPVYSISESGGTPRPMMMDMAPARASSDVPIATGEVSLSAQVAMIFEITD